MARYRKIEVQMWGDSKFRCLSALPPCGQGLWLYLLTNVNTGPIPGLFRAGRAAMSEELGWSLEDFDKAFQEVFTQGMVKADFDSRVVWIPNAIKHNRPESPNVVISWGKEIDLIPECDLKDEAINTLYKNVQLIDSESDKPEKRSYSSAFEKSFSKALSKAFKKSCPNQDQDQEQNINPTHNARGDLSDQITNEPPNVGQEFLAGVSEPIGKFSMLTSWHPSPDFRRRAATWGVNLPDPEYLPAELASFSDYWISEGKVFTQVQWEQKFARHIVQVRAKPETGGMNHAGNRTGSTASRAVQEIDAAYEEWQRRHGVECGPDGMASMAGHGGNIFEPLEPEERGGTFGALDSPDRFDD